LGKQTQPFVSRMCLLKVLSTVWHYRQTSEDLRQEAYSDHSVLAPGDIDGLLGYIREDFDKRAYFITGH